MSYRQEISWASDLFFFFNQGLLAWQKKNPRGTTAPHKKTLSYSSSVTTSFFFFNTWFHPNFCIISNCIVHRVTMEKHCRTMENTCDCT